MLLQMYIKMYNFVTCHDNAKVHLLLLGNILWMKSTRFNRNQHLIVLFSFISIEDELQAAESIKTRGGIHL